MPQLTEAQRAMVSTIRDFVRREVQPVAQDMEHADEYPVELVERMKEMGLFGAVIPEEYGGLELDVSSYALVIEEICRGWMSLSGILNSHLIMAYMVATHGTPEQKEHFLPLMATGEKRGGICITEPNAGSDVQAIETRAVRDGDEYVVNGSKSLITNGRHGNTFALVTKTDPWGRPSPPRHQHLHRREGAGLQRGAGHSQARLQGCGHLRTVLRRLPRLRREPGGRRGG